MLNFMQSCQLACLNDKSEFQFMQKIYVKNNKFLF